MTTNARGHDEGTGRDGELVQLAFTNRELAFVIRHGRSYKRRNGDQIRYLSLSDIPGPLLQQYGHLSGSLVIFKQGDGRPAISFFKNGQPAAGNIV